MPARVTVWPGNTPGGIATFGSKGKDTILVRPERGCCTMKAESAINIG